MGSFGQRVKALSFPPSPPQPLGTCSLKHPLTSSSGHLSPSKMIKFPFSLRSGPCPYLHNLMSFVRAGPSSLKGPVLHVVPTACRALLSPGTGGKSEAPPGTQRIGMKQDSRNLDSGNFPCRFNYGKSGCSFI